MTISEDFDLTGPCGNCGHLAHPDEGDCTDECRVSSCYCVNYLPTPGEDD